MVLVYSFAKREHCRSYENDDNRHANGRERHSCKRYSDSFIVLTPPPPPQNVPVRSSSGSKTTIAREYATAHFTLACRWILVFSLNKCYFLARTTAILTPYRFEHFTASGIFDRIWEKSSNYRCIQTGDRTEKSVPLSENETFFCENCTWCFKICLKWCVRPIIS